MSQIVGKVANYTCTEFPKSREFYRLTYGIVNTLHDFEIDTLLGANIGPIGKLAKGIDGAFYGKRALEDIDAFVLSVKQYDTADHKASLYNVFSKTVSCTGNVLAISKWLGTVGGIVMLTPYAKSFGYVKNVCSVYSASVGIIAGAGSVYAAYQTNNRAEGMLAIAMIISSSCSLWLSGMGGLDSYIGATTFAEKGLQRLQPWTFNTAVLVSNATAVATKIAKS